MRGDEQGGKLMAGVQETMMGGVEETMKCVQGVNVQENEREMRGDREL